MSQSVDPSILSHLFQRLRESHKVLLHYDAEQCQLIQYSWPLNEELEPVDMDIFIDHQRSHSFAFPGCFCPALSGGRQNVESAIFVAPNETYEKRHIAACSTGSCEYIVNMYFRPGQATQYYPRRVSTNPLLPRIFHPLENVPEQQDLANLASAHTKGIKRNHPVALRFIPAFYPPCPRVKPSTPALLYRLHSAHRPGLTDKDFHNLFMRCDCGVVSTKRKHASHVCLTPSSSAEDFKNVSILGDGDFLHLLYTLDTGVKLAEFAQMFARCTCGLVMTRRRFSIHECLLIE